MMRSRSETEDWLRDTLKGGDSMDGKRLKGLASDSGLKERTLYRAAQAIGVTMLPGGFGKPRRWHLCPMPGKGCHVCLTKTKADMGEVGRHGEPAAVAKVKPIDSELKATLARAKMAIRPEVRAAFVTLHGAVRHYLEASSACPLVPLSHHPLAWVLCRSLTCKLLSL